jgi:hypothetical protein
MKTEPIYPHILGSKMITRGTKHIQSFTSEVSLGTNYVMLIRTIPLLTGFVNKTYNRAGLIQKAMAAHGGDQV